MWRLWRPWPHPWCTSQLSPHSELTALPAAPGRTVRWSWGPLGTVHLPVQVQSKGGALVSSPLSAASSAPSCWLPCPLRPRGVHMPRLQGWGVQRRERGMAPLGLGLGLGLGQKQRQGQGQEAEIRAP
jgi:hypothetical protein